MRSTTISSKKNILVDIDAILDTRLGVIRNKYGDEVAQEILESKAYHTRVSDEFHLIHPAIKKEEYALAYLARNDIDLLSSRISCGIHYLKQFINRVSIELDGNNPFLADIHLVINFGRYDISDADVALIMAGISYVIDAPQLTMEAVRLDIRDITLQWLDDHAFYLYFLYDFNIWSSTVLPDREAKDLAELGLKRYENLLVSSALLVNSESEYRELQNAITESGFGEMANTILEMPWNILFELELLPASLFCEYDPERMEEAMKNLSIPNSAIDTAVDIAREYMRLKYHRDVPMRDKLADLKIELEKNHNELMELLPLVGNEDLSNNVDKLRIVMARKRFLTDVCSSIIPSNPTADFECFYDSLMSYFDVTEEAVKESEKYWNEKGIKCNMFVKEIPRFNSVIYVLYVHEDCTDLDGKDWKKNDLLHSHLMFDTPLQPLAPAILKEFMESL